MWDMWRLGNTTTLHAVVLRDRPACRPWSRWRDVLIFFFFQALGQFHDELSPARPFSSGVHSSHI